MHVRQELKSIAFDALPLALVLLDGQCCVQSLNGQAEHILGVSQARAKGKALSTFILPHSGLFDLLRQYLETEPKQATYDFDASYSLHFQTGLELWCHVSLAPFSGGQDEILSSTILCLQPLKRFDNHHDEGQVEKGAKRGHLNTEGLLDLVAMMAHEIKNPLAGIKGAAQLLEESVEQRDRDLVQLIVAEVDRLSNLVDDMDGLSDRRPLSLKSHNIHKILSHCQSLFEVSGEPSLSFKQFYDPSLPLVQCDEAKLKQVIINLFKNSLEAYKANPVRKSDYEIGVETRLDTGALWKDASGQQSSLLQVRIFDQAGGIPQQQRQHLFQPRISNKKEGKGLGLSLVRHIISRHQGWIETVHLDGGTAFTLFLPMLRQSDSQSHEGLR